MNFAGGYNSAHNTRIFKNNLLLIFGCVRSSCCLGFFLVAASRGYSLVAMHGLLIAVASLVAEHGL